MRILLTGSNGFLGYNFYQFIRRTRPNIDIEQFDLSGGKDVRNYDQVLQAVEGKDLVIHAAAQTHVDFSLHSDLTDQKKFVDTNVNGTLNVIAACKRYGVKLIHISTSEVYGTNQEPGQVMTESHPIAAQAGIYATSKACADLTCRMETITNQADIVILRLFNLWGVHQSVEKAIPRFISQGEKGEDLTIYGDGEQVRDYLNVVNACEAIWRSKDLPSGTIANVATGEPVKINDLAKMIADSFGVKLKHVEARPGEVRELRGRYAYFESLTGWYPTKFINKDTIKELIGWYTANQPIQQPKL